MAFYKNNVMINFETVSWNKLCQG